MTSKRSGGTQRRVWIAESAGAEALAKRIRGSDSDNAVATSHHVRCRQAPAHVMQIRPVATVLAATASGESASADGLRSRRHVRDAAGAERLEAGATIKFAMLFKQKTVDRPRAISQGFKDLRQARDQAARLADLLFRKADTALQAFQTENLVPTSFLMHRFACRANFMGKGIGRQHVGTVQDLSDPSGSAMTGDRQGRVEGVFLMSRNLFDVDSRDIGGGVNQHNHPHGFTGLPLFLRVTGMNDLRPPIWSSSSCSSGCF